MSKQLEKGNLVVDINSKVWKKVLRNSAVSEIISKLPNTPEFGNIYFPFQENSQVGLLVIYIGGHVRIFQLQVEKTLDVRESPNADVLTIDIPNQYQKVSFQVNAQSIHIPVNLDQLAKTYPELVEIVRKNLIVSQGLSKEDTNELKESKKQRLTVIQKLIARFKSMN